MADYWSSEMGVHHFNALAGGGGDPLLTSPQVIYIAKTRFFGYISAAESIGVSLTTFAHCVPKATEFGEITRRLGRLRRSRSSKVTEFGTSRKLIRDFLLVIN